jgi:hypothetical protein
MKNHVQSAKTFRGFWLVLCEAYDLMLDNENHWSPMLLGRGDRSCSAQPRRFHTETEAQTEKDRILDGPPIEAGSIFPDTTDGCWTPDDRQWLADHLKTQLRVVHEAEVFGVEEADRQEFESFYDVDQN